VRGDCNRFLKHEARSSRDKLPRFDLNPLGIPLRKGAETGIARPGGKRPLVVGALFI